MSLEHPDIARVEAMGLDAYEPAPLTATAIHKMANDIAQRLVDAIADLSAVATAAREIQAADVRDVPLAVYHLMCDIEPRAVKAVQVLAPAHLDAQGAVAFTRPAGAA